MRVVLVTQYLGVNTEYFTLFAVTPQNCVCGEFAI